MQEGIQLPELLAKIKALREAGLRAEHVAFSFMKRRVQPLMARDTLGYQYTSDDDTSQMLGVKSMTTTSSTGWGEYSKTCRRTRHAPCPSTPPRVRRMRSVVVLKLSTDYVVVVVLTQCASCRMT
jgi:hypothetical protein